MSKKNNNGPVGCLIVAVVFSIMIAFGFDPIIIGLIGMLFFIILIVVGLFMATNDDAKDKSAASQNDVLYDVLQSIEDSNDNKNAIFLTQSEFNKCKIIAKQLLNLCRVMSHNDILRQGVIGKANDIKTIENEFDDEQFFMTLKQLLGKDVLYCYRYLGLKPEMNKYTHEGQLLWPITVVLAEDHDDEMDYSSFSFESQSHNEIARDMWDCHEEMFKVFKDSNVKVSVEGMDDFMLVLLVKLMDCESLFLKDLRNDFYQMASLIADVAGINQHMLLKLEELKKRAEKDVEEKESSHEHDLLTTNDLEKLIGLQQVKKEIKELKDFIEVNRRREDSGMKTPPISYHCVFTGNPGTGKTTVARIVAGIYKELGILQKGHLVETDRSGLVAEYVGQTAVKTNKVIDSALDGVLFIDEAYSLIGSGNEDYGKEAIATLVKRMEDNRDRLVVILAGYEDEMQLFIESNPGLRSRFNRFIHFEDYTAQELKQIFLSMLQRYDYILQGEGEQVLRQHFEQCVATKGKDFGNARYVRNLFERTIKAQSVRLAAHSSTDKTQLATIIADDINSALDDKP